MILAADSVGELVHALAARTAEGSVSKTFPRSAYIGIGGDYILLLRGPLRSPMTVNVGGAGSLDDLVAVGDRFELNPEGLASRALTVSLDHAQVYRGSLRTSLFVSAISEPDLVRAATMLKLLYSVSDSGLGFLDGKALEEFVGNVIIPLARGNLENVYETAQYMSLVGSGSGFTPAGDDFLAGFIAAFNLAAGAIGVNSISLPRGELSSRTVSESASILDHAQRGQVDEGLERLILAAFCNRPEAFRQEMMELASRGHTSGLDLTLGVLLSAAAVGDYKTRGHALESSLESLRNS